MIFVKYESSLKRLTKRAIKANRARNIYIISAITLTMLLIVTVFSIGMSYLKSNKLQQIRLMGTTAHAAVTNLNDEQVSMLRTLDYIKSVGLQHNVGLIKNTVEMKDMVLTLHWYSKEEWKQFRSPAVTKIEGSYPVKYDEIMVPVWILETMGISNPRIGMEITLDYYWGEERREAQKRTFTLSGYFTDYAYIRSGNLGSIFVSEEFAKTSGSSVEKNGAASVGYIDDRHIEQYNQKLIVQLSLSEGQKVKTVPMYESKSEDGINTAAAFAAIVFFLMFTGYLLIYNVMYISVTRDIRFYGLLKAVGTTPKQLRKVVMAQALRLAAIGIPAGMALGTVLSFVAVPRALSMFDLKTGAEISFNPLIYIGAAVFSLITTLIGAARPAEIAARISPVEALRFNGVQAKGKRLCSYKGAKPYRMAWRNIFRDRKRAAVVLLSLFLGIMSFMLITTLISSMDTDNYIASYVKNDFILKNNTMDTIGNATGIAKKHKFDQEFVAKLQKIEGVTNFRTTLREEMKMTYDPAQFAMHMEWFWKKFNVKGELKEKQIADNFWGYVIGLDIRYIDELNKSSKTPIDIQKFEQGEIALIGTDNAEVYSNVDTMEVTIASAGKTFEIPLGGIVPFGFQLAGGGMAPNIYVSETALKKWVSKPYIYKINMDVNKGTEERALEKIKELTDNDNEISRTSRLEQQRAMTETKLIMFILGGGVALVLAFIGILNFINVMFTGIMVRKLEFAMLESVGMTKRQLHRMLMLEGTGYAGLTAVLAGALGTAFTYIIFKLFQLQADYAIFTFPFIPVLIIFAIVFLVCIVTPQIAYRSINRASIVERLREVE